MTQMLRVCDGPACRIRAADLGLGRVGVPVGCLGRCDAPVAALSATGRALVLARRGADPEPAMAPGAQRGPWEPALLRDVFFADQAELAAARRRGAYRALAAVVAGAPRIVDDEGATGA